MNALSEEFDATELQQACASLETMDLRTLEFALDSTQCPSTTSERVTNLHILVPAISHGMLAHPHELKRSKNPTHWGGAYLYGLYK